MTAPRTDERFAPATDAVIGALGGAGSWSGRRVAAVSLVGGARDRLSDAVRLLGAELEAMSAAPNGRSRVVDLSEIAAWQQTVLTTVGRATNLGFAQASVHVHGAGVVGLGLARRLAGFGARVTVSSADPVELVAAADEGLETSAAGVVDEHAVFLFATGESTTFAPARLGPFGSTLVVIDAAQSGRAPAVDFTASGDDLRPGLVPVITGGRDAVVLRVDELRDDAFDAASADIRAAFALLLIERGDVEAADRALAEIVLT